MSSALSEEYLKETLPLKLEEVTSLLATRGHTMF